MLRDVSLPNWRDVSLSKALSSLLRHNAVRAGIAIRPDAFCLVDDVLQARDLRILAATVADVERVVENSPKQRFEVRREAGELLIRAVQGHSMPEVQHDLFLRNLSVDDEDLPEVCVHGTKEMFLPSILHRGLLAGGLRGSRNHVHCQPFEPFDERVLSGFRDDSEIAIYLDLRRALADGVPFSVSRNNVILSPGIDGVIPPVYFVRVRNLVTDTDLVQTAAGSSGAQSSSGGLHWLCGLWKDTNGSRYKLSHGEDGVMSVCTTRPSGEVIHASGLIHVDEKDGDKIIWGRPGARQYILERQTHRSLCWRARSIAQPFIWERLEEPEIPEDDKARRARHRREWCDDATLGRRIADRLEAILGRPFPTLELRCGRWCPVAVAAALEPTSDHEGAFSVPDDFEPTSDHDGDFNRSWREPGTPDVFSDRVAL